MTVDKSLEAFTWREEEVFVKMQDFLQEEPVATDGIMYAYWNRKSPICLQAHIDVSYEPSIKWTCCKGHYDNELRKWVDDEEEKKDEEPKPFKLARLRNIITNLNGVLGGDDRAGIMIMMLMEDMCIKKNLPKPSILLTNKEETGSAGMRAFIRGEKKSLLAPVNLVIALDRRGCGEYVYYTDPGKEVRDYIESFGFIKSHGSYSDSKLIADDWGIPAVNLSIGYYNNHSKAEIVHLDEAYLTLSRVKEILLDPIAKRYSIPEPTWKATNFWTSNKNDDKDTKDKKDKKELTQDEKFDKKRAALIRRMAKCNLIIEKYKLPGLARMWPYLDYMLPNEMIRSKWHIVTSPDNAKALEEWENIFAFDTNDEIARKWKETFGKADKIYVKSSEPHMFHLAIRMADAFIPISAFIVEGFEQSKIREYKAKIQSAAAKEVEDKAKASAIDKTINEIRGYCFHYYAGDCSGGCHGDQKDCDEPNVKQISIDQAEVEMRYCMC
jgi:hypothetical protein